MSGLRSAISLLTKQTSSLRNRPILLRDLLCRHGFPLILLSLLVFSGCDLAHVSTATRKAYLQRAKAWHRTDVPRMDIFAGPRSDIAVLPESEVTCEYVKPEGSGKGFSPKFPCKLVASQKVVRVKYQSREVYGEVAGSRLLWALGFYADENYPVKVRCLGCAQRNLVHPSKNEARKELLLPDAMIERNFPGAEIGEFRDEGWKWDELSLVDPSLRGSSKSEIDALKLLAVFIQHTDSKHQQQRLACYPEYIKRNGLQQVCKQPVLMVQDLGATFGMGGPEVTRASYMYFRGWRNQHIWNVEKETGYMQKNPGQHVCFGNLVSAGNDGLFDPEISEAGRRFLSQLLNQLSDKQIGDLFRVGRADKTGEMIEDKGHQHPVTIEDWISIFKEKRQEINDRQCR